MNKKKVLLLVGFILILVSCESSTVNDRISTYEEEDVVEERVSKPVNARRHSVVKEEIVEERVNQVLEDNSFNIDWGSVKNKVKKGKKTFSGVKNKLSSALNEVKITETPGIAKNTDNKKVTSLEPKTIVTQKRVDETSNKLFANVKLISANRTINNNHVGNEWRYYVEVNGKKINLGETLRVSTPINVQATAVEQDKVQDKGTSSKKLVNGKNVINVKVTENRGRYSGEFEIWKFVLSVQYK